MRGPAFAAAPPAVSAELHLAEWLQGPLDAHHPEVEQDPVGLLGTGAHFPRFLFVGTGSSLQDRP